MPYKCLNCGSRFEEPVTISTTYESYYGVCGMFPNSTPMDLEVCPWCHCEDIEETHGYEAEESEDEIDEY